MTEYQQTIKKDYLLLAVTLLASLGLVFTAKYHGAFWAGITALWIYVHINERKKVERLNNLLQQEEER